MKNLMLSLILAACASVTFAEEKTETKANEKPLKVATATFAGGCFWCMEAPFDNIEGVISTTSGYIGGHKKNPTYREICSGTTGHTEAVQVKYYSEIVPFQTLLDAFWKGIDPTQKNGQFADRGTQYRTGIFYHDEEQKKLAEASKKKLLESGKFKEIHTEITKASIFYPAEDYHQDYYKKNPTHYKRYSIGSGRVGALNEIWGEKKKK